MAKKKIIKCNSSYKMGNSIRILAMFQTTIGDQAVFLITVLCSLLYGHIVIIPADTYKYDFFGSSL